ncbi:MAG TPA: nuclear transport factor 2 family protein [Candidatus Acidoferrum sp.]|nr:nuclear transport factor 2 family protein [Candidatus Acidoferrum sp.]
MKTRAVLVAGVAILITAAFVIARPKISVAAARSVESLGGKASDASLQEIIVAKEREGLDALKAGNVDGFANLTAEEAVFVDGAGPADKAQVVKNVNGFTLTTYSIEDVKFVRLGEKTGLISYRITETGNSHGKEFAAHPYISSIWTERGSKWVCLFSQETLAR